jgi:[acyl-carrier-protein] S-malonyltransferase
MFAVTFPGQGSQSPGMGRSLYEAFPASQSVFKTVSQTIGIDVAKLCFESDDDTLRQTQNAQIALFTCGMATWEAIRSEIPNPDFFAGHSVGEYAAVCASGALSLEDAARLVWKRGELMKAAPEGTMAAILGLEKTDLQALCEAISGVVVIANDNCPGQLVISGEPAAVLEAMAKATDSGAKRALPLNVSGAFHSPLMEAAASEMGEALRAVSFKNPTAPVIANVLAAPVSDGSQFPPLLEQQLKSSVRWTESLQFMTANGVDQMLELGAKDILCGLMKRVSREVRSLAIDSAEGVAQGREFFAGVNA